MKACEMDASLYNALDFAQCLIRYMVSHDPSITIGGSLDVDQYDVGDSEYVVRFVISFLNADDVIEGPLLDTVISYGEGPWSYVTMNTLVNNVVTEFYAGEIGSSRIWSLRKGVPQERQAQLAPTTPAIP